MVAGFVRLFGLGTADLRELRLEFLLALFQGLEPKLPAMKLDTGLIDITCDFNALRFVLFELLL